MNDAPIKNGNKQGRNDRGQFSKGHIQNPTGRPKGAKGKATIAALELMNGQLEQITQSLINAAIDGDLTAIKIVLDKLIPQAKELPLQGVSLPTAETTQDLPKVTAAILDAASRGELLPSQGTALTNIVAAHGRIIELTELEARLSKLEEAANV